MLPMELQKEMPDASPNSSSIDVHQSKPNFFRDEGMFYFIYLGIIFPHMLHPTTSFWYQRDLTSLVESRAIHQRR